jgi:hypothetical protein
MNFVTTRPTGPLGKGTVEIIGGDEAGMRAFIAHQMGRMAFIHGDTLIYIGQMPFGEQRVKVPGSEQFRIIGSVVRQNGTFEAIFETALMPQDAAKKYEELLLVADWNFVEDMPGALAGFTDGLTIVSRTYCQEATDSVLRLASNRFGDITSLHLTIDRQVQPCKPRMMPNIDYFRFVPTLKTPPKARLLQNHSSSSASGQIGARHFTSSGSIFTETPVPDIAAAYQDQLSRLGWRKISEIVVSHSAVSIWQFTQDNSSWDVYFILAANPSQKSEYLMWLNGYEHSS